MQRPRRHSGFTLIELVLVLMVLAICAAISAPSLSGFARARTLPNTAADLVTTANWCRVKALSDGVEYRLNLDESAGTWWVTKDKNDGTFADVTEDIGRPYTLPEGVTITHIEFAAASDAKTDQGTYVSFSPGGKTEVTQVTLAYQQATLTVACTTPLSSFHVVPGAAQ